MLLLFNNACQYNDPDSQIYKDALTLLREMLKKKQEVNKISIIFILVFVINSDYFQTRYGYKVVPKQIEPILLVNFETNTHDL